MRKFSDIKLSVQAEEVKKRIQIVESRLIRKTSLLYERRLINSPELAALGQQVLILTIKNIYMAYI